MKRTLCVAVTLAFCIATFPASSAEEPGPAVSDWFDHARAKRAASAFDSDARMGHPLLGAPVESWLPKWLETGDLQQVIIAVAIGPSNGPSLTLHQLGDANGDGKMDVLLETSEGEGDEREWKVEAVSGADYSILWAKDIPKGSYWYLLGDVTADNVHDLVLSSATSSGSGIGQGVGGVFASTREASTNHKYEIVSGGTGQNHATASCQSYFNTTRASASTLVGSAGATDYTWNYCYLQEVGSEGNGFDIVTASLIDETGVYAYALAGGASVDLANDYYVIQRFDASGKKMWSAKFTQDTMYLFYLTDDFTGDGVDDLLFETYPMAVAFAYTVVDYTMVRSPLKPKVFLVDGKTGATLWTRELDNVLVETTATNGGPLRGEGKDVLLHELRVRPGPSASADTTIIHLNGKTGQTLATKVFTGTLAYALGLGDLDGDGKGDLLRMSAPAKVTATGDIEYPETIDLAAVKADHSPIWGPMKVKGDEGFFETNDLNGDGAMELVFVSSTEGADERNAITFRVVSGRDASTLWSFTLDETVLSFGPIGDVTGDDGEDLALTVFEIPLSKRAAQAGPPSARPAGSSPTAESREDRLDYANYPGFLEIRRGADKELVWRKQIHDPSKVGNVSNESPWTDVLNVGDTNGNGHDDIIYNLGGYDFFFPRLDDSGMPEEDEEPAPRLEFALLIEGLDGSTLKGYPNQGATSPAVFGKAARIAPKATSSGGGFAPGFELVVLLMALGAVAMRRRAT